MKNWRIEDHNSVSLVQNGVGWMRFRDENGWTGPWMVVR